MGRAVEMCSGLGVCRKTIDGTMCPSYMATREEKHSTRGRANTLRLAMAGRLGESGLGDHDVHDVLDLCLECRACKAECPVGVDVARFKSEFLAGYWKRHGMPLRDAGRSATSARLSAWGSRIAPIANAVGAKRVRTMDQRAVCSASTGGRTPPAVRASDLARRVRRDGRPRSARRPERVPDPAVDSLQRHVHQLQPSRDRRGRDGRAGGVRASGSAGAARAAADVR